MLSPAARRCLLCSESGWDLHNSRLLLQESHAAHEWGGAAEEHAKAMIGEPRVGTEKASLPLQLAGCGWLAAAGRPGMQTGCLLEWQTSTLLTWCC